MVEQDSPRAEDLAHKAASKIECTVDAAPVKLVVDGDNKPRPPAASGSQPTASSSTAAPLPRSASLHHVWEDDVGESLNHGLTQSCRDGCTYSGIPRDRVGHKPLLLATVHGVDKSGQPFQWLARRARKRLKQPHEISKPQPPLRWLPAFDITRHYAKPGWWVASLFLVGSVFWIFTAISRLTTPVSRPAKSPPGLASLSGGIGWVQVVALYTMFFPACVVQLYEAMNMEMAARKRAWQRASEAAAAGADTEKGAAAAPVPPPPPPRPRSAPTVADLRMVSFWLASFQLFGMLLFMTAVTTGLVGMGTALSAAVERWVINFLSFIGAVFFSAASWLGCLEHTGSYWRGCVPSHWSDLRSVSWIAVFFSLQGSLGFMIFGIVAFSYLDISWPSTQGILAYGQLWASFCFIVSSTAGLLEQENPGHM
ncbi:hypothetical protein HYH02_013634 [Chlamydomonas schloesseri]|uniref:Uncharacterized protein n=1 Tax=Chlamydomonas schloesseri TaxID=2026947 RepID=A0A835SRS7_9CHLO|nr:hypothetical protein HYH02_013634 [Chlamydomonas schloesseri]|eukprot:KAG2430636.1 hypothetical protein HYH02_013634 [Chlamydomonas schloesseri]